MLRAVVCIVGVLLAHGGLAHTLSLVGRRHKRNGALLHSIALHRYHVIGLGLALTAGILLAFSVPPHFLALQIIVAVVLLLADELLIYRAIRAVEAH